MRRQLVRMFIGASFIIFLSPFECVFHYCQRHDFNPPICEGLLFPT